MCGNLPDVRHKHGQKNAVYSKRRQLSLKECQAGQNINVIVMVVVSSLYNFEEGFI